ncbi:MAG: TetR/AcrR family transcriptional regulator [Faecousia sp.]
MAVRSDGLQTEKRILRSCVRLFLENGYHRTTMAQILKEAQVSSGSFQNLFRSKDGVLLELFRQLAMHYEFSPDGLLPQG